MDWFKVPDVLSQAISSLRPTPPTEPQQVSAVPDIPDNDDDLGIVRHQGIVPFRRVESAVHTFTEVAVPADLDRLHRHQNNIKKWRRMSDSEKLRTEYINSGRTVKQLTRNLKEMELLRAKVLEEDIPEFDRRLKPAKEQAFDSICEFLTIHGEGLNANGEIANSHRESETDRPTDSEEIPCESTVCGDLTNDEQPTASSNLGAAQMRGNQIVIESDEVDSGLTDNIPCATPTQPVDTPTGDIIQPDCLDVTADSTADLLPDPLTALSSDQVQIEAERTENDENADELWDKLRKDLIDLHSTIRDFSALVYEQGEVVDNIAGNIEVAEENISKGKLHLRKATVLKAAMFPILGAVVGGVVGGPIGFAAGLKLGSVGSGLAAAGMTGTVIGYQGGKMLKRKQERELVEMQPLNEDHAGDNSP